MNPDDIHTTHPMIDWQQVWDHLKPWLLIVSACAVAIVGVEIVTLAMERIFERSKA